MGYLARVCPRVARKSGPGAGRLSDLNHNDTPVRTTQSIFQDLHLPARGITRRLLLRGLVTHFPTSRGIRLLACFRRRQRLPDELYDLRFATHPLPDHVRS